MDTYLVTVYGWPDKREGREPTRIVLPMTCTTARVLVTGIANRLAGLFTVDIKLVDQPDIPAREGAEILRGQDIIAHVTKRETLQ